MSVLFIADFYNDQINGGGENNDAVLIQDLELRGVDIERCYSNQVTREQIDSHDSILVSNFILLSDQSKTYLANNANYIIYEHDHKYVSTRDPSKFPNFKIPQDRLVNIEFYQRAKKVVVLSQICKDVLEYNLGLTNVHSIGSSLWSAKKFSFLKSVSKEKHQNVAIVQSGNPTKGTPSAVQFCNDRDLAFEFIGSNDQYEFLENLAQFRALVFIPQVLETFCRLVAEAKMLECNVYTNPKLIGMMSEPFATQSGDELIETLEGQVGNALEYFYKLLK